MFHYRSRINSLKFIILLISVAIMTIVGSFLKSVFATNIIELTDDTFDKLVKDNEYWLVEFYASWCPHCKRFVDDYLEVGRQLKGQINVGAIDASKYVSIKKRFEIKGYPTFKLFGCNKSSPIHYKGPRTVADLVEAALELKEHQC